MHSVVFVSPFRCRMWPFHDRLTEHITEETCKSEIESFLKHGQLVPVLGRALHGDPDHEVELVCGARRLFVAQHVNKPLMIDLRDISDTDAIVAMDIENRQRADVSAYERGVGYARWLKSGYFKTQDDLARALKISASQVSRLLRLARLPAVVVDAFDSPLDICEGWGVDIMDALEDPKRRSVTLSAARAVCKSSPRPAARDVYRQLLAASARGRKPKAKGHDEVVKDHAGNPLFRIRHQNHSIALLLPREKVSARSLENIREHIREILHDENDQSHEFSKKKTVRSEGLSEMPARALRFEAALITQMPARALP